jgi:hypothetical protein
MISSFVRYYGEKMTVLYYRLLEQLFVFLVLFPNRFLDSFLSFSFLSLSLSCAYLVLPRGKEKHMHMLYSRDNFNER